MQSNKTKNIANRLINLIAFADSHSYNAIIVQLAKEEGEINQCSQFKGIDSVKQSGMSGVTRTP